MFELFSKNHTSKIILSPNAEACVKLAAADLRKNLLSLSGKTEGFEFVTKEQNHAITVTTDPLYHFTDIFPETSDSMEFSDTHIVSKEKPTRFVDGLSMTRIFCRDLHPAEPREGSL